MAAASSSGPAAAEASAASLSPRLEQAAAASSQAITPEAGGEPARLSEAYVVVPLPLDPPTGRRCSKQQLRQVAEETVRECGQGWYENQAGEHIALPMDEAVASTYLLPARSSLPACGECKGSCSLSVVQATTLQAAQALVGQGFRTCVLNFASAKNPGGGFLKGASAQEESLARSSGLYPCLLKQEVQQYYQDNERDRSCVYTDHMVMSSAIPVFKDDNGVPLDAPYVVGMLTAPAPNFGEAIKRHQAGGAEAIKAARQARMARTLGALVAEKEFDALVLGAWGCGVFRNEPEEVAEEFRDLLCGPFRGAFRRIAFAVLDPEMAAAFKDVLVDRRGGGGGSTGAPRWSSRHAAASGNHQRGGPRCGADAGGGYPRSQQPQQQRRPTAERSEGGDRKSGRWRKQRSADVDD